MAFHPRYWSEPVKNGSAEFNYYEWNSVGRKDAAKHVKSDTASSRSRRSRWSSIRRCGSITQPGGIVIFSAAHMHSTVPNTTGRARYSIDFRTVNRADLEAGRSAPNVDTACTGTSLRDFVRGSDGSQLPDDVVAKLDDESAARSGQLGLRAHVVGRGVAGYESGDSCGRARQPDPGGDGGEAEADGRDRRASDPLAHHEASTPTTASPTSSIALGYKGEVHQALHGRLLLARRRSDRRAEGRHGAAAPQRERRSTDDWTVDLVDTGQDTATGGRIKRLAPYLGDCDVHADVGRRRRRHRPRRAARVPPLARQARDADDGAPAGTLRPPRAGRRRGLGVLGEAAARRGLDQRRLLRARAARSSTTSRATTRPGSASRSSGSPRTAS